MTEGDILHYENASYTDDGLSPASDEAITAFGKWAADATAHFKGENIISS